MTEDTIFALSSGRPPAGIGVIRVSGPAAFDAARRISGGLPEPRRAVLRAFRDGAGDLVDRGLLLASPGPSTATGEDLVEFHCHGGRAVMNAMLKLLQAQPGLRPALAGEFTRRALTNGVIDLTEAEGLADLLAAETEVQRRTALRRAEGGTRRQIEALRDELLSLSARVELAIDYVGEDDADQLVIDPTEFEAHVERLGRLLESPPAERLRDGFRVLVAGPPNAGKSSLINALADSERAIVTDVPGTTRDLIEVPVALNGLPLVLIDSAGLRESDDQVEQIGVARAREAMFQSDLILWLGSPEDAPPGSVQLLPKADLGLQGEGLPISSLLSSGIEELRALLVSAAETMVPSNGELSLTERERSHLQRWRDRVDQAACSPSLEISAEALRLARSEVDAIIGRTGIEELLDSLFSRFCVGK